MGEDVVYNSINSMIEESKYCSDIEKKFNKELVIKKENDEHFENSTKYWICDNVYADGDVKVRDHCHITGTYRGSAPRDCILRYKI